MRLEWIWLAQLPGVGGKLKAELISRFPNPVELFWAEPEALDQVPGMTGKAKQALLARDLTQARQILARCGQAGVHLLTCRDAAYPSRLKTIPDPPMVLYYKGILPQWEERPVITMVGTRRATSYGIQTAKRLGFQIASCGGILASGMARGIDAVSMAGALSAGGQVVGVLGCGADIVYPPENRELYRDAEKNGCLLSEYPPGTPPAKWQFPQRNRIMAGLACGVVVVEAPESSGALITARLAMDLGRDVFAVPGNIDLPGCVGSNRLLREGASAVTSGWEVLEEYQPRYPDKLRRQPAPTRLSAYADEVSPPDPRPGAEETPEASEKRRKTTDKPIDKGESGDYSGANTPTGLTGEEQRLYEALSHRDRLLDDVAAETQIPATRLLTALTTLRLKGLVRQLPGNRIGRT